MSRKVDVLIRGYSDSIVDITCVEQPALTKEHYYGGRRDYIEFSTRDVFMVHYSSKGIWEIQHTIQGELENVEITKCRVDSIEELADDSEDYSDILHVTGVVEWIDPWEAWPPSEHEVLYKLTDRIQDLTAPGLTLLYALARVTR